MFTYDHKIKEQDIQISSKALAISITMKYDQNL